VLTQFQELKMIYTSEKNWYKWGYDDTGWFGRKSADSKLITSYSCEFNGNVDSFENELLNAARSTLDHYPNLKPSIFFSGGVDSEMILRAYLKIGADPKVYIVKYENDYNSYDVNIALEVCRNLCVDYDIIDFNLENFYLNDAEQISDLSQIDRPRALPHIKFTENVDGLIILGQSDLTWYRTDDDYTKQGTWLVKDLEHDLGGDKYNLLIDRPAIYQWWKWTPGLIISYTRLNWFRRLLSDKYPGKLGINSTKIEGFREVYPDLIERKKATGLEKVDHLVNEFENFLYKKHNGFPYRDYVERSLDQLIDEIHNKQT
jgi:hypothetical protein